MGDRLSVTAVTKLTLLTPVLTRSTWPLGHNPKQKIFDTPKSS